MKGYCKQLVSLALHKYYKLLVTLQFLYGLNRHITCYPWSFRGASSSCKLSGAKWPQQRLHVYRTDMRMVKMCANVYFPQMSRDFFLM